MRTRSYCAFASFEPRLRVRTADGWCEQRLTIFFLSAVSGVNYFQEAIDFNDGNQEYGIHNLMDVIFVDTENGSDQACALGE